MKKALEIRQPRFRVAGDSAYPRSVMLVTPFSNEESDHNLRKRLFNLRHAGLRAEYTETIFGNNVFQLFGILGIILTMHSKFF